MKNSNSENIRKIPIPKNSENSENSESEMILGFPKFWNRWKPFLNSKNFGIFSETVNSDPFHPNGSPSPKYYSITKNIEITKNRPYKTPK